LVETPFIDLSFRAERSPFQRRRSEKRPPSVFQKRARAEFPRRSPLLGEVNATRKTKRIFFSLLTFKRVALTRRVCLILSSTLRRLTVDAAFFTYFPYFSGDVKRRIRRFSENGDEIRSAGTYASKTKSP
jgi:hypothetical protein